MAIAMASSPVSTSLISGLLAGFTCNMYSLLKSMDKLAISITISMNTRGIEELIFSKQTEGGLC